MYPITAGATVKHKEFGVKGDVQLQLFVIEVSEDGMQALCSAHNEDDEKWLPISELTLVKPAPSGHADD